MTHEATELTLYAYNTFELYGQFKSIIANYQRKIANGTYDAKKAPMGWLHWYQSAARLYCKEFGCTKRLVFPISVLRECANETADLEYQKIMAGEYA